MMFKEKTWPKFFIVSIFLFLSPAFVMSSPVCRKIDIQQLYKSLGIFSNRISYEVARTTTGEDYVISPFSINTCMAMTRLGATGDTANEIDQALALIAQNHNTSVWENSYHALLKEMQKSKTVTMANKLYVAQSYTIKKSFQEILSQLFYSNIEAIDFVNSARAAKTINEWVESKTNNLITNLVAPDSLDETTKLVLVNAIHFKANWQLQFNTRSTSKRDFYFQETEKIMVDMMDTESEFKFVKGRDYSVIQLPYADSNYSMLIYLPNSRDILKFEELEKTVTTISLPELIKNMRFKNIELRLPKFKTEFEVDLKGPLENLGIKRLLSDDAELYNMLENGNVQVSKVVHKAVISVNEQGTEAAAATFIGFLALSAPISPILFHVNHPFYYNVVYNDEVVLFQGKQTFGLQSPTCI